MTTNPDPQAADRLRRARERGRLIADSKRKAEAERLARIAEKNGVLGR